MMNKLKLPINAAEPMTQRVVVSKMTAKGMVWSHNTKRYFFNAPIIGFSKNFPS